MDLPNHVQGSAEPSRVELDNGIVLLKVSLASQQQLRRQQQPSDWGSPLLSSRVRVCDLRAGVGVQ